MGARHGSTAWALQLAHAQPHGLRAVPACLPWGCLATPGQRGSCAQDPRSPSSLSLASLLLGVKVGAQPAVTQSRPSRASIRRDGHPARAARPVLSPHGHSGSVAPDGRPVKPASSLPRLGSAHQTRAQGGYPVCRQWAWPHPGAGRQARHPSVEAPAAAGHPHRSSHSLLAVRSLRGFNCKDHIHGKHRL